VKVATVPANPPSVAVDAAWPAVICTSVTDAVPLADAEMKLKHI
jgi:hypothetical protein